MTFAKASYLDRQEHLPPPLPPSADKEKSSKIALPPFRPPCRSVEVIILRLHLKLTSRTVTRTAILPLRRPCREVGVIVSRLHLKMTTTRTATTFRLPCRSAGVICSHLRSKASTTRTILTDPQSRRRRSFRKVVGTRSTFCRPLPFLRFPRAEDTNSSRL